MIHSACNQHLWIACLLINAWFLAGTCTAVEIETVPVGNPGADGPNFVGAERPGIVEEAFRIGKYEVTNSQYAEFLNAVDPAGDNGLSLYHANMGTSLRGGIRRLRRGGSDGSWYGLIAGREEYPVVLVSWYDAARFTNWLHNGQGSGGTESGAYDLASHSLDRNADANWFLPTRAEWVKAAYHSNNTDGSFYHAYPTTSDSAPTPSLPTAEPGRANTAYVVGVPTTVGAYTGSPSAYGTFDQAGNVREWTGGLTPSGQAGIQGGSWFHAIPELDALFSEGYGFATTEGTDIGFRVAMRVPEPSSASLLLIAWIGVGVPHRRAGSRHDRR